MSEEFITFIAKEKLLEMIENKEDFILVDVSSAEDYAAKHLPDSLSLPVNEITEEKAGELFPGHHARIVVYSEAFTSGASTTAARKLHGIGYKNVMDYQGGVSDWEQAGLPFSEEKDGVEEE